MTLEREDLSPTISIYRTELEDIMLSCIKAQSNESKVTSDQALTEVYNRLYGSSDRGLKDFVQHIHDEKLYLDPVNIIIDSKL
jgi:hypothetical protein